MTARASLDGVAGRLAAAGCESPRVDAEILLAHVLGVSRSELRADLSRALEPAEAEKLEELARRREAREPLAYVIGEWGFRRLTLAVDRRVLVPRPETEVVVERCLARLEGAERPRVLDVGTGSGAIALAIADEHPGAQVTGIDVSLDALAVARDNVARTGVAVEMKQGDAREGLPAGPWDLVVANPPYVRPEDVDGLRPEVRAWEPRLALVGEGLTDAVASGAASVLVAGGALVLEVAEASAGAVADLLGRLGYEDVVTTFDLAGRERVVDGVRAGTT